MEFTRRLKQGRLFCCFFFLFAFLSPLNLFAFPVQSALPHSSFEEIKADIKAAPYHETRPLSEVWDSARDHEEAFTFLHEIPSSIAGTKPTQVVLLVFPKITSGLLSFSEAGKVKPIFGKDHQRYPPLVSYEGDQLTLFQLIQSGHRACEIKMTVQQGEIVTAKESAGCADYESKGHLLSKALIGAKMAPPIKRPAGTKSADAEKQGDLKKADDDKDQDEE